MLLACASRLSSSPRACESRDDLASATHAILCAVVKTHQADARAQADGLGAKKAAAPTHASTSALVDKKLMKTPRRFSGALKDRGFTCASWAGAWGLERPVEATVQLCLAPNTSSAVCGHQARHTETMGGRLWGVLFLSSVSPRFQS